MNNHKVTREGDEYACSCGLRWDVDDCDPHRVVGFDPAKPGADRTVEATYESGKLRLDSIRELIKD